MNDNNGKKVLNEFNYDLFKEIAFIITVSFGAIHFIWKLMVIRYWINHRDQIYADKFPLEEETTLELRKITGKNELMVRLEDSKDDNGHPVAHTTGGNTILHNSMMKKMMTKDEMMAICLHEFGHIDRKHGGMLIAVDASHLLMLYTFASTLAFFGMPFALLVIWLVEYVFGMKDLAFTLYDLVTSKHQEYVADSYAAKYGYGAYFISAHKKMEIYERNHICQGLPKRQCDIMMKNIHKWGTHPTNDKRIKKVSKLILKRYFKITKNLNPSDLKVSKRKLSKLMKQKDFEKTMSEE